MLRYSLEVTGSETGSKPGTWMPAWVRAGKGMMDKWLSDDKWNLYLPKREIRMRVVPILRV